jgi:hypothetical protein
MKRCSSCKKSSPEVSFSADDRYCLPCRRVQKSNRHSDRRSRGLCRCGRVPIDGTVSCIVCKNAALIRRRNTKSEVIQHYGGKCQCPGGCAVSDPDFLTIDHILGDGAKHRKETGLVGSAIYSWLKRRCFPEGFRLLCWNCNVSRYQFGSCPHERRSMD